MDTLSRRCRCAVMAGMIAWFGTATLAADWDEGMAAFSAGRWADAAAAFDAVTQAHEEYAAAYFMLGRSLGKLGRTDDAISRLQRASELDASNAQYALALGQAQVKAGAADEALVVIARHPMTAYGDRLLESYERVLASAATAAGDRGKALTALDRTLEEVPDSARLWRARGNVMKADGDHAGAYESFKEAYALDSSSADAGHRSALAALAVANELEESERKAWLRKAAAMGATVGADHSKPALLILAGDAYLGAGESTEARQVLEAAAELSPQDPKVAYKLGRCALADEDTEQAHARFDAALALGPGDELRRSILTSVGYAHRLDEDFVAAADAYRRAGRENKVAEMEQLASIAEGNREHEQMVADCRRRQQDYASTRAEAVGKLGPADLAALELEIERKMLDCQPYLESAG